MEDHLSATDVASVARSNGATASILHKMIADGAGDDALLILLEDACAGRFDNLALVMQALSGVGGVRLLLDHPNHDSVAVRLTYELAGLSPRYFPLFAACVDIARETSAAPGLQGADGRGVLDQALETPEVAAAQIDDFLPRVRRLFNATQTHIESVT